MAVTALGGIHLPDALEQTSPETSRRMCAARAADLWGRSISAGKLTAVPGLWHASPPTTGTRRSEGGKDMAGRRRRRRVGPTAYRLLHLRFPLAPTRRGYSGPFRGRGSMAQGQTCRQSSPTTGSAYESQTSWRCFHHSGRADLRVSLRSVRDPASLRRTSWPVADPVPGSASRPYRL